MCLAKNDEFQLLITDMSEDGSGIGKMDGFTWFVKDAVIGDTIEAKVMKKKKNYGFARLLSIVQPSKHRVIPLCPVARQCGGCQLQPLDYQEQLRFKQNKVYHHLLRIGKFTEEEIVMEPIIGMDNPWRYRNKAQFPFGVNKQGEIVSGFYAGRTHAIIEQHDCLLGREENQQILTVVKQYMKEIGVKPYDEESHRGLIRHVLIRSGFASGQIMVCVVINGKKLPHSERLVELLSTVPGVCSISFCINKERTNVIMGNEVVNLLGEGYIMDAIGEIQYRISPLSFYQVNPVQTERLYQTALDYAGLTGAETVWDLYCGIGTISLFLAQRAKQVYGVEIVPEAIADAKENASINGIENVTFFVGKAETVLPELYEKEQVHADVIVVDPPRKGCDEACLGTIVNMQPKRVVYVSCDSATLARDLRFLADRGYRLERVRCCDMFPMTGHVECVVEIRRVEK